MKQIYIGYDPREITAYRVCVDSLRTHTRTPFVMGPVNSRMCGSLYRRPDTHKDGVLWDTISRAPMSTEFSVARFLVPHLAHTGWALFCDGDFLWRGNVNHVFDHADSTKAVMVVQHDQVVKNAEKMDGQVQRAYRRKNWSSLMLMNCDLLPHYLTLDMVNTCPRDWLHSFDWLRPELIGALPVEFNWLAGVSEPVANPLAVHFTLGTPDMPGYEDSPYADEWRQYACGQVAA